MKIPTKRFIGVVALIVAIVGPAALLFAPHLAGWARPRPPVEARIAEPGLKPGYYKMESAEEARVGELLSKSRFIITIGWDGISYRDASNYVGGLDMAAINAWLEKTNERQMAIIHEAINFASDPNDKDERDIIALLQAKQFRTIVITCGTGNRGGTLIERIIGDCNP